ncbi:MAG: ADP-ribosylation factor-directed GTPase activating protein isoform b [Schlesneria sp.]|nr:ADP-ribosylation factor-directed GTPase activating protein isoform b [Schlesneria sp.]
MLFSAVIVTEFVCCAARLAWMADENAAGARMVAMDVLQIVQSCEPPLERDSLSRAHWLLVFGERAFAEKATVFEKTARSLLVQNSTASAFSVRNGLPHALMSGRGVDGQGHQGQFLAYLSLCGAELAEPVVLGGDIFTLDGVLRDLMLETAVDGDLSWALIAFSRYLSGTERWVNKFDERVDLDILLRRHSSKDLEPYCRGHHHFMAFSCVASRADWAERPLHRESLQRIKKQLNERVTLLEKQLLKSDPTEDVINDMTLRTVPTEGRVVYEFGHALEWLSLHLSREDARSEWVLRLVSRLCEAVKTEVADLHALKRDRSETVTWRWGNLGHASAGLGRWLRKSDVKP